MKSERAIMLELRRIQKRVQSKKRRTVWEDGYVKGCLQALAWASGDKHAARPTG